MPHADEVEIQLLHKFWDDAKVPRADVSGAQYSLLGRLKRWEEIMDMKQIRSDFDNGVLLSKCTMGELIARVEKLEAAPQPTAAPTAKIEAAIEPQEWTASEEAELHAVLAEYPPETSAAPTFPERDAFRAAEQQGIFRKFDVQRVDGRCTWRQTPRLPLFRARHGS